jgi:hypothetical protein
MANTATNVLVGVTGSIYYAPAGTAVPTTVGGALNGAFVDVGYISEDGVSTSVTNDSAEIKAWQNGDIVRRIQTSHDFTLAFAMLETNAASLELYWGNYTAGAVEVTGDQPYRGAFVVNVVDDTSDVRYVIPDGQITERGELTYVNGEAALYQVTLTTYPDVSGVKAYIYYGTSGAS